MACFTPLKAYRAKDPSYSDTYITFDCNDPFIIFDLSLPCGKCIGCKLEYARQWATRCVHEASLHDKNCFLTLTYSDDHCPRSVNKIDWQLFMKRLRFKYPKRNHGQISYFMCGEYGEQFSRPHYHACLFNFDFPDKVLFKKTSNGDDLFTSEILDDLWDKKGHCWIGSVTNSSASYVARYTAKKVSPGLDKDYYGDRNPEFTLCSRRPSIGLRWIEQFYKDVYNYDSVVLNSSKQRPPRYYDKFLEKNFPDFYDSIKVKREANLLSLNSSSDVSLDRRNCMHEVQLLRQKNITRSYESSSLEFESELINLYDQRSVDYHKSIALTKELL